MCRFPHFVFVFCRVVLAFASHHQWVEEQVHDTDPALEEDDLCACRFSAPFDYLLLVTRLGQVTVYQAQTGAAVKDFSVRPLDPVTSHPVPLHRDARGCFGGWWGRRVWMGQGCVC